jgi:chromosome segregation ATPase
MRLWLLLFVFVAAGYESVLEWRKTGRELNFLNVEAKEIRSGAGGLVRVSPSPSTAAGAVASGAGPIQAQEKLVADAQEKTDALKTQLDSIERQREKLERTTTSNDSGRVEQARQSLEVLEEQKRALIRQEHQERAEERTRQETLRLSTDIQATQLRDQISREQSTLAQLNSNLRGIQAANMDTDQLRSMERSVTLQTQKISELQRRYWDLQFQYGQQEAAITARRSEQTSPDGMGALDEQIRRQREVMSQAEREHEEIARRQQAGVASSEALDDRAAALRGEYFEALSTLGEQKSVLSQMKNAPTP